MKKILFVLPSLGMGGLEKMQVNLANALVSRGYDVTVMTLENFCPLKEQLDKKVKFIYKPPKPLLGRKIPYIKHKFYDDGMWEKRASAKNLYNYYVGKDKYDVEIAFFRGLPVKIISGSTSNAVKLCWAHNDFRKAFGYTNNFSSLQAVFNAYSAFDRVVCVSNMAKEGFIETIGDTKNLTSIYNFIPPNVIDLAKEDVRLNVKKYALNAVVVGRLSDEAKGQTRLISAIKELNDEGLNIGLTIVGDGRDRLAIEDKIREYNLEDYVTLVGEQKNPYPFIKNADLLVCSSYYEGYNLTVAEALILGIPVMSTYCAGPVEILDDGKYGLIVENSEAGIKEGLRRLVDDKELLLNYKLKAKERVDFFSEEKIVNQIENLWKD